MDETYCLAFAALRNVAEEMNLETILVELRRFYREALDDPSCRSHPDYARLCESSVRALDAALWRLERDDL
jgi:hypothetical protein